MSETAHSPVCPVCARRMILASVLPRVGGLSELRTFRCEYCNVVFTEAASASALPVDRALNLNYGVTGGLLRRAETDEPDDNDGDHKMNPPTVTDA